MKLTKSLTRNIQEELDKEASEQICPNCHLSKTPLKRKLNTYLGKDFFSSPMWVCQTKTCALKQDIAKLQGWTTDFPKEEELVNYMTGGAARTAGDKIYAPKNPKN